MLLSTGVITKDQSATQMRRQGGSRFESCQVHKIKYHTRLFFGNALSQQALVTRSINGDVSQNARKDWRQVHCALPAMAKINAGRARKKEQRTDRFNELISVNDVRRRLKFIKIIDHRDAGGFQLSGHGPQQRSIDQWLMAARAKSQSQIPHV